MVGGVLFRALLRAAGCHQRQLHRASQRDGETGRWISQARPVAKVKEGKGEGVRPAYLALSRCLAETSSFETGSTRKGILNISAFPPTFWTPRLSYTHTYTYTPPRAPTDRERRMGYQGQDDPPRGPVWKHRAELDQSSTTTL